MKKRRRSPGPAKQAKQREPGLTSLVAELEAHRVELEAQNRSLREAYASLELSRDRYAELFDFAPVAYVTLDEMGIIRHLNFAASSLLGRDRQSLINFPFLNFVGPEHSARYWEHINQCRHGGTGVVTDLDLRVRKPASARYSVVPVQLRTSPGLVQDRPKEYPTAVLDLSDRRLAEERDFALIRESALREDAERASRAKDEFFTQLAHELRTPLNAIHGWTYLLGTGQLSDEDEKRAIEVITRNVQVQVTLIDDMLDLSRIVRGDIEVRRVPIQLGELVNAAVDTIRPLAAVKNLRVDCQLDETAARTTGDAARLTQVLANLLSNAVKFTPAGGRIAVRLHRGLWRSPRISEVTRKRWQECARITVSDTGHGIAVDDLDHVFDRFWRGQSTYRHPIGGLGIGLAIARQLVELHDGDIWVESGGEDHGATFTVELPLDVDLVRPESKPPARATPRPADLQGVRILLVDDDREALNIVIRELEPLGATVTAVSSAREAYETIQELRPDLLLSDLAMPEEDGLSLIQRIRRLPSERGGVTPAVALTAWAGAGDEKRVLEAGFQTFVAKPVDAERLGELIGSIVGGGG
jgi:PAS domain S-box-containing protein